MVARILFIWHPVLGNRGILVVCPKPLLDMATSVLRKTFNILPKQVIVFEFSRADDSAGLLEEKFAMMESARKKQSVLITTPEAVKALMLK